MRRSFSRNSRIRRYPNLPEKLNFLHAEEILDMYPDLPRKQRETAILQKYPAVFIIGIGWTLKDGYPHEMRAADYDDWVTETKDDGHVRHGLNGDILVWNPVTHRRHELTSMGIRVNAESLRKQLELTNQLDFLKFPYHKAIVNHEIPLSVGGGIGQSRTLMLLLRKAHLGEVSVTVWPKVLKEMCEKKNIHVLELTPDLGVISEAANCRVRCKRIGSPRRHRGTKSAFSARENGCQPKRLRAVSGSVAF